MGRGEQLVKLHHDIDDFHKWQPLFHSFVFMLIRHAGLILKTNILLKFTRRREARKAY